MIKKIHHVGIVVRSLEDGYHFYRDILGLPAAQDAHRQGPGGIDELLGDISAEVAHHPTPGPGLPRPGILVALLQGLGKPGSFQVTP